MYNSSLSSLWFVFVLRVARDPLGAAVRQRAHGAPAATQGAGRPPGFPPFLPLHNKTTNARTFALAPLPPVLSSSSFCRSPGKRTAFCLSTLRSAQISSATPQRHRTILPSNQMPAHLPRLLSCSQRAARPLPSEVWRAAHGASARRVFWQNKTHLTSLGPGHPLCPPPPLSRAPSALSLGLCSLSLSPLSLLCPDGV